jgi:hypothetical protein
MKDAFAFCEATGVPIPIADLQRPTQAREPTSDGQPENIVGIFPANHTFFKHPESKYAPDARLSCARLLR